jgi:uncharacterized membrane protein
MTARGKQFVGGMVMGAGAVYWLRRDRRGAVRERLVGRTGGYGARLGDIAGLEAASIDPGEPARRRPAKLALRAVGGALVVYGLLRRNRLGKVARLLGLRLLAPVRLPSLGMRPSASSASPSERRQIVDIQKSLHIDAPVEQVYAFWSNYESFPLFMSNVREVEDLGGGRSRWSVRGPGGAPLSWTARLMEQQPNTVIAWRSEPGAMLEHAGVVRFRAEGVGTQIDLRLCYRPPIGRVGQAATELFGADPRTKLNEDLGRLKALLEATVRSESHGQKPGS